MKFTFKQVVEQGEILPRFYGVAHIDYMSMCGYAYPIPFNHVVRFSRWLYFKILTYYKPSQWEKQLMKAFEDGREYEKRLIEKHWIKKYQEWNKNE